MSTALVEDRSASRLCAALARRTAEIEDALLQALERWELLGSAG